MAGECLFHGKRVCGGGQTGCTGREVFCTVEVTLLLVDLWFPHIGQKPGVGGAALGIVHSGLVEAQFAVYGVADLGGVRVLLAVIFPPADRTQGQSVWRLECPVAAARASKKNRCRPHAEMDAFWRRPVYKFVAASSNEFMPAVVNRSATQADYGRKT